MLNNSAEIDAARPIEKKNLAQLKKTAFKR